MKKLLMMGEINVMDVVEFVNSILGIG